MNSRDGVSMEVPAVRRMAKSFNAISTVLKQVSRVLQTLMNTLKATAFVGMVGGLAIVSYIEQIKPQIDQVAKKCAELSKDLAASVDAYERGDTQGATRFY